MSAIVNTSGQLIMPEAETRANGLENPANALIPRSLVQFSHGNHGMPVDEETAMLNGVLSACVELIGNQLGSVPLCIFRELDRGQEKARDHHLFNTLKLRINPEITSSVWVSVMVVNSLLWGDGFSWIERDGAGRPLWLWPLRPWNMQVQRINGEKTYFSHIPGGKPFRIPKEDVIHLQRFGFDGIRGRGILNDASLSLGASLAAKNFVKSFFENGASVSGILSVPEALDDAEFQQYKNSWNEAHQGSDNAFKTAFLEEGMTYTPVGIPPSQAQLSESQKDVALEITRYCQVPPHMVGLMDDATFSNIEHQRLEFHTGTLLNHSIRFAEELTVKLFNPDTEPDLFVSFGLEELLRGDYKSRMEGHAAGVLAGILAPNEPRLMEMLNPLDGFDEPRTPLNMTTDPAGGTPKDEKPEDEPEDEVEDDDANEPQERMLNLLRCNSNAVVRLETDKLKRAIKNANNCEEAVVSFYAEFRDTVCERMAVTKDVANQYVADSANVIGAALSAGNITEIVDNWAEERAEKLLELAK